MSDQPLDRDRITKLVSTIFADDLHAKRVASLAGAAVSVLEGAALGIHAIGKALAMAAGTMLLSSFFLRVLGRTGVSVIERIMGIVLTGLSVQFVYDGLVKLGLLGTIAPR